jgi:hypothetical protein
MSTTRWGASGFSTTKLPLGPRRSTVSPARSFVVIQVDTAPSVTRFTVMRSEPSGEGGREAE